jgi:drug/metabolite transporter (DMT)-like permease
MQFFLNINKHNVKYYLYCFIAIFLFSTLEIVSVKYTKNIEPLVITAYRFFIGAIILFIFSIFIEKNIFHEIKKLSLKSLLITALLGVLNVCISMIALQKGILITGDAGLASIIISSHPIFIIIFEVLLLKSKFDKKNIILLFCGIIGLFFVVYGQNIFSLHINFLNEGILYLFIASITFALYITLSVNILKTVNTIVFNIFSFLSGSVILFIYGLIQGVNVLLPLNNQSILSILYLGFFVTGISYHLYFLGLKNINNLANGTIFFILKPVFTCFIAYFALHEILSIYQLFGVFIVIFSFLIF